MATVLVLSEVQVTATTMWPWLYPVIAVGTLLLGGGGVAALIKARADRHQGVAQLEVTEDDAISNRWKSIIETQTKSLLEPLQARLREVEGKVESLEVELDAARRKYWNAVAYIRTLLIWINRHLPNDIETTSIPDSPAGIAEDL